MTLIATDFHDVKTPFASQLSDELQVQQEYFILKYIKSNVEFDPKPLFQHFSDDIRYASQQVLNDLVGKDAVAEYMTGKNKTLKRKKHEWRYDFNRGYIDNVHEDVEFYQYDCNYHNSMLIKYIAPVGHNYSQDKHNKSFICF